jgi:hypothetical protein
MRCIGVEGTYDGLDIVGRQPAYQLHEFSR